MKVIPDSALSQLALTAMAGGGADAKMGPVSVAATNHRGQRHDVSRLMQAGGSSVAWLHDRGNSERCQALEEV